MKKLFITFFTIIVCLTSSLGKSADIVNDYHHEEGLVAAQKGDWATALRIWKPLAEQGYDRSQYNLGVMYCKG